MKGLEMELLIALAIVAVIVAFVLFMLYKSNMDVPASAERYVSDEEADRIANEMQTLN